MKIKLPTAKECIKAYKLSDEFEFRRYFTWTADLKGIGCFSPDTISARGKTSNFYGLRPAFSCKKGNIGDTISVAVMALDGVPVRLDGSQPVSYEGETITFLPPSTDDDFNIKAVKVSSERAVSLFPVLSGVPYEKLVESQIV